MTNEERSAEGAVKIIAFLDQYITGPDREAARRDLTLLCMSFAKQGAMLATDTAAELVKDAMREGLIIDGSRMN